jgi:hypothetical protein
VEAAEAEKGEGQDVGERERGGQEEREKTGEVTRMTGESHEQREETEEVTRMTDGDTRAKEARRGGDEKSRAKSRMSFLYEFRN